MWGPRSGSPTFTSGCFCCIRLIVTNDQTDVFNCSLLLNTAVSRRLVTITSGEEECQCLATWQHARAVHVKLLLPMHYVAKNELNLFYPLVPPNFQNVVAPMPTSEKQDCACLYTAPLWRNISGGPAVSEWRITFHLPTILNRVM